MLMRPRRLGIDEGWSLANALRRELAPSCLRIEVAGSLRREQPQVGDMEICAIPTPVDLPDEGKLFHKRESALWHAIELLRAAERVVVCKPGTPADALELDPAWDRKRGLDTRFLRLYLPRPQVKVDLFIADRDRWGQVFATRTGSKDFSHGLARRWKNVSSGGYWDKGLVYRPGGEVCCTPEEKDLFALLQVAWIEPRLRRSMADVRPIRRAA